MDMKVFAALIFGAIASGLLFVIVLMLSSLFTRHIRDSNSLLVGVVLVCIYIASLMGFFLHDWVMSFLN